MAKAIVQKQNRDGFVKPGELIEIRSKTELSLQDRRIINLLIENAWSEIGEDKVHQISMARLRGPTHKGSERVADSIIKLMVTLVEVPTTVNDQPAILSMQLLGPTTRVIDEDSPSALLIYRFSTELRKVILQSGYWGRIKAYVMFAFSSKYALALYEAVCLRINLRTSEQTFSLEAFREMLGVEEDKYPAFPQLKQKVITPAVAEVNALSDFTVSVLPVREGGMLRGKLTGFMLRWEKKPTEEWQLALDELNRPRLGRRARIAGTVETVF